MRRLTFLAILFTFSRIFPESSTKAETAYLKNNPSHRRSLVSWTWDCIVADHPTMAGSVLWFQHGENPINYSDCDCQSEYSVAGRYHLTSFIWQIRKKSFSGIALPDAEDSCKLPCRNWVIVQFNYCLRVVNILFKIPGANQWPSTVMTTVRGRLQNAPRCSCFRQLFR